MTAFDPRLRIVVSPRRRGCSNEHTSEHGHPLSQHKYRGVSPQALTPGRHTIRFEFAYDGGGIGKGGTGTLFVDGAQVVRGRIEQIVRAKFSLDETFDVGADTGTPVIDDYADGMPFEFTGRLQKLTIDLKGGAEQFQQGAVLENPLPQ